MFQTLKKLFARPPRPVEAPPQAVEQLPRVELEQGNQALAQGQLDQARQFFERACEIAPNNAEARCKLGLLHMLQDDLGQAEFHLRRALTLAPAHPQSLLLMAEVAGRQQGQDLRGVWLEEATTRLAGFLAQHPDDVPATTARAFALWQLKRPVEAETLFQRLLDLGIHSLDNWSSHGQLLWELGRFDAAISSLEQALALNPNHVDSLIILGMVLHQGQKRYADAAALFRRAAELAPTLPAPRLNLALALLIQGQFAEGWPLYEARLEQRCPALDTVAGRSLPPWRGEPIAGRRLVVIHEQGFGDTLQFCRYLPRLKQAGAAQISLLVPAPLQRVMQTLAGVDTVCADLTPDEAARHDFWVHPLSLPGLLSTELNAIPATLPYLTAPEDSRQWWRKRLPQTGLKLGLVWRGRPSHTNDAQRSLPGLLSLAPLWQVPGIQWVSLQKGAGESEALAPPANQPLVALGQDIGDFADLAAVIAGLDLVISVDTAVVHLAGALGKPCWVLLPYVDTDWRWLGERNDSPWYPDTLRLFRQGAPGKWDGVIDEVASELRSWAQSHPSAPL